MNKDNDSAVPAEGTRINRLMAQCGLCSRREADIWIAAGRVTRNGRPVKPGDRILPTDEVLVDGNPLPGIKEPVILVLNKPVGVICTTDHRVSDNVVDFIGYPERIYPVGRLDRDSHGLLILTNNGDLANGILHASNRRDKEYRVTLERPFPDDFLSSMSEGVPIMGRMTRPCKTERLGKDTFRIVLQQGLNRQIRKMSEQLGYEVVDLVRVRIMNITLGSLKPGHWRALTHKETRDLQALLSSPKKARKRKM